MAKRKRAQTLTELAIVKSQIHDADGRFHFLCQWRVGGFENQYKVVSSARGAWSAGSVEEMLAAIQAAKMAIESTPGIEPVVKWWNTTRCRRCGVRVGGAGHTEEQCRVGPDGTFKERRQ